MNQKNKLIIQKIGVPGERGPQGEPGGGGTGATLPIDSADIVHNGVSLKTILDNLLFVTLTITSFSTPIVHYEIGTILLNLFVSWAYSKEDIVSQAITGTGITPPILTLGDRAYSLVTNINTDQDITLTTDDGSGNPPVSSIISLKFSNKIFYGKSNLPGSINSAFIKALSKQALFRGESKTFTETLGISEYVWICFPSRYSVSLLEINGFGGGFESPLTVSFTNDSGYIENYTVLRNTFDNLGYTTIQANF